MSRAGAKQKAVESLDTEIPMPPKVVTEVARAMRDKRWAMIYARCRWVARGRNLIVPEMLGTMIADNILNQIMQQMMARQSKLVVPKPKVVLKR